jgi:NAD(P)-dependent dehydrogenase (short-subunit alcohol dehydrogenase family)
MITGATDGIGKQTAIELALKNATIILHGRNNDRLLKTKSEITTVTNNNSIEIISSDLSSLKQTKILANEISSKFNRIDVLINNAGVYLKERKLTKDGIEKTLATNHLSHFLLTNLLLDLLKQNGSSRIINVSSVAHTRARLDFDNINSEKSFDAYNAYAVSKLANVLFAYKLASQLKNTGVTVNALHPGVINTKLLRGGFKIKGNTLSEGAETPVYLASSEEVEGVTGKYFVKKRETESAKLSYDENIQEEMWEVSEQMIKNAIE